MDNKNFNARRWLKLLVSAGTKPAVAMSIFSVIYIILKYLSHFYQMPALFLFSLQINKIFYITLQILITLCFYWLILNIINKVFKESKVILAKSHYKNFGFILQFLNKALNIIILLSLVSFTVDCLPVPEQYAHLTDKITSILIIIAIASILVRIVKLGEQLIAVKYNAADAADLAAQKAHTQVIILGRIVITLICLASAAAVLMLFENVRELGKTLLTSAGILSVAGALAAGRSLSNLADGLQIMLNQLIKINDLVIIENEFGQIEEINLYYIVIKLPDLRRLVVPVSYFIQKSFINLSRRSTDIIGNILIYVDYTFPIPALREALKNIIHQSAWWDKKSFSLNVVGMTESAVELKIFASAKSSSDLWNLQCDIREKILDFSQSNYPDCLPQIRTRKLFPQQG